MRRHGGRRTTTRAEKRSAEAERRALRAIALMRRGFSRQEAARRAKTTPQTVQRYAAAALRRHQGKYEARSVDTMHRPMRVLTEQGVTAVDVRHSSTASRLARYWNAVDHYLRTGDRSRLALYAGKRLRASGRHLPYITDADLLDRLAEVGEVRFEDLYEATA